MVQLRVELVQADVLEGLQRLQPETVHCVVTSPPYYRMREYPSANGFGFGEEPVAVCEEVQSGGEGCGECYVCKTLKVLDGIYRVLHQTGVVWWNVGDKYSDTGAPLMIPFWIAVGAQRRGWLLRDMVVWAKQVYEERIGNTVGRCIPESLRGWEWSADGALKRRAWRTSRSWEPFLMLVKRGAKYFADRKQVELESYYEKMWSNNIEHPAYVRFRCRPPEYRTRPHKNLPSVWRVSPGTNLLGRRKNFSSVGDGHVATMPLTIADLCVRASASRSGCCSVCRAPALDGKHTCEHRDAELVPTVVLDPFCGSGTSGVAALQNGCSFVGIDISPAYIELARKRLSQKAYQIELL